MQHKSQPSILMSVSLGQSNLME